MARETGRACSENLVPFFELDPDEVAATIDGTGTNRQLDLLAEVVGRAD
ncbi:MAG: hypothetical protein ACTH2Q_04905 [Propionibacteriaceae bacterium]